jgi:Uma2 family endonuclease
VTWFHSPSPDGTFCGCYYIQHEAIVRAIEQIDLDQFPPPDLAVEVDIASSSLDRFSIYADLGTPEVWRYDGQSLTIYSLQEDKYKLSDRSVALSLLKANDISNFLGLRFSHDETRSPMSENSLVKQFRQWLKTL